MVFMFIQHVESELSFWYEMADLQLSILLLQGASAEPYMLNISINISGNYCQLLVPIRM